MKKLFLVLMVLVASGVWAEWTGASLWHERDTATSSRFNFAGDFISGYFAGVDSVTKFSAADKATWTGYHYLLNGFQAAFAVDEFYKHPENVMCPDQIALRAAIEYAISKTPDGIRLLNIVYANVGGWKPFTTWAEYKAGLGTS